MKIKELEIPGVFSVENFFSEDSRGVFVKTFHYEQFKEAGLEAHFQESYYSRSVRGVIRGMHFQAPPVDHHKLVYVTEGEVLDVIVDLRKSSLTYQRVFSVSLKAFGSSIYIPKGCAHGFLTLSDRATLVYNVSTVYSKDQDKGILWSSIDFDWGVKNPILSSRDASFPSIMDFDSPF